MSNPKSDYDPYRNPDVPTEKRLREVEKELSNIDRERLGKSLRTGINVFLILAGSALVVASLMFGISQIRRFDLEAERQDHEIAQVQRRDRLTAEETLRAQCSAACETANMGLNRAVIADGHLVACGCVSPTGHRTLWDDRSAPAQLCTIDAAENALVCNLQGRDLPRELVIGQAGNHVRHFTLVTPSGERPLAVEAVPAHLAP